MVNENQPDAEKQTTETSGSAENLVAETTKKKNPLLIILIVLICILLAGGGALAFWIANGSGEEKPVIGYESQMIVSDEDSLQKAVDEMKQKVKDSEIALEFKHIATSNNGTDFQCYVMNSAKNKYDMFLAMYTDSTFEEELYKTQLIPPGNGIDHFTLNKKFEKGEHEIMLVYTLVKDDHQTIQSQVPVVYTLQVK